MTPARWRKTAFTLLALMAVVVLVFAIEFNHRMTEAEHLREVAQSEQELGQRVHAQGAGIVQEMHTAILRVGDPEAAQADRDRVAALEARAHNFFNAPPVDLSEDEKEIFATVLEDLRLHREQADAWIAEKPEERLGALTELEESRNTLANDIRSLGDVRADKLLRRMNELRESAVRLKWVIILLGTVLLALAGFLIRAVILGWLRPLAEKAASADRVAAAQEDLAELGTVAAGLAHEIRNPVGALKNRAYALSLLVEAESNPKASAQIASMDGELDRIERIVRDFLRYARPADPRLAACTVAEVAESFHRDFCGEMGARGVSFQVHVENNTLFQADAQQVRQVLLNLTRNAADACSGREHALITLQASTGSSGVVFAVSDNGPGLTDEARGNLFVPFASSKRGGTGLGLAVSRAIARKHGGELLLAATGPSGTRFELHLPA